MTKLNVETVEQLKSWIRDIPDFPKPGILFRDITPLLQNPHTFAYCIDQLTQRYAAQRIDAVAAVEARGFILGSALAYTLKTGLIPIRKEGKLPHRTSRVEYALEYGSSVLEIHKDAVPHRGARILLVDDLLATGGTIHAAAQLIEQLNGAVAELAFLVELTALKGRSRLDGYPVYSLIQY
ncbi:MAG: adenine phosphoribosyltransferase [Candidatus Omnitrophica bacterium]|nr:adenine phosphoribosyltransferase [Candidatus Omnitrophota bacterium]